MHILKSQTFNDDDLIHFAASLSLNEGDLTSKLLHWDFGPLMTMKYDVSAENYLFSDENVPFHWDGAFYKEPKKLLFYCTETDGTGGETLFTDTEKIWDDLSAQDQELLKKVTMIYRTQKLAHYGGEIRVPLVQIHPHTGKTILRIAEKVETKLNPVTLEMTGTDRGDELYADLITKLYSPRYMYQHSWEKGDVLICDNFTYLHGRNALGANKSRSFKRIQIL
jgi:alpha-ketoglutarate-dependent taurine dioxygenase